MTIKKPVSSENILPEGVDYLTVEGAQIRKGTVAAFIANIALLEDETLATKEKEEVLLKIKQLIPDVIKVGLTKHVTFNNETVQSLIMQAS